MKRHGPLHAFPDARVDVALFFIPPHRLRPIDVDFITELSELVPVGAGAPARLVHCCMLSLIPGPGGWFSSDVWKTLVKQVTGM